MNQNLKLTVRTTSLPLPNSNLAAHSHLQIKGKLLGVPWDKSEDTLGVNFSNFPAKLTKQGILANLAKVYDPLGLVSPMMLDGKRIYRETCNQKITWDTPLPEVITRQWIAWEK